MKTDATTDLASKILIIDDDAEVLDILCQSFEDAGYLNLASITDSSAALRLFEDFQPDLIVLDLLMPERSGMELLAEFRAMIPKDTYLPILVVTGSALLEAGWEALDAGATDFLRKPFAPTELILRSARLLATRSLHLNLTMTNNALRAEVVAREHADSIRKESEDTLEKQREFLSAVLESLHDGIVACDQDGVLTLFNGATREFHGLPDEPIPAEEWAEHFDLFRADGVTRLRKSEVPLFRALQGEQVRDVEMVIAPRGTDVKRFVLSNGRALADANGNCLGAVVAMHDITERERAAEALRAALADVTATNKRLLAEIEERRKVEAALRESERTLSIAKETAERANAAKTEFLSRMSHELRTPLNAIIGFGQLLELDAHAPEEADNVARILKAGRNLLGLVDKLLDISGAEGARSTLRSLEPPAAAASRD